MNNQKIYLYIQIHLTTFIQLWLALSDRYLQNKDINWKQEEEKCFSETWGADDQELGVQIVKVRSLIVLNPG